MGFNTGAWSGVLVAMVLFGQHLTAIALAAMAGVSSRHCLSGCSPGVTGLKLSG